ncbi:hypothetical protein VN0596_15110 [Helicobacter pylori]
MRSISHSDALKNEFHSIGVLLMTEIKFSGVNDSSEFVSCGRFVQFTDKQGLGCPLYKLYSKKGN